jgi:hypothetical protein
MILIRKPSRAASMRILISRQTGRAPSVGQLPKAGMPSSVSLHVPLAVRTMTRSRCAGQGSEKVVHQVLFRDAV